jgi:hypothetical protein
MPRLRSSVQNRTIGGKLPSVHAVDFGPYCSRSDSDGLAFNLDLLLAARRIKVVIAAPAFLLAQAFELGGPS